MRALVILLFIFFAAGCSAGTSGETTAGQVSRTLEVEQLASGERGPDEERVVVASSASRLASATGVGVPEAGEGVYVLAGAGQQPTGGYAVEVESARRIGDRVSIRLSVTGPGPDQIATQALTYPYAVAVIRNLEAEGLDFSIVDSSGEPLGWPVVRANQQ